MPFSWRGQVGLSAHTKFSMIIWGLIFDNTSYFKGKCKYFVHFYLAATKQTHFQPFSIQDRRKFPAYKLCEILCSTWISKQIQDSINCLGWGICQLTSGTERNNKHLEFRWAIFDLVSILTLQGKLGIKIFSTNSSIPLTSNHYTFTLCIV